MYSVLIHLLLMVSGKLPPRKIDPRSGSGFGLRLALELGLGPIFSEAIFLEPLLIHNINSIQYQYTIHYTHWDKRQMLKTFFWEKINVTNNVNFFLSRAYHSFTSNSRFFNEMKHKVSLSISVCWIFYFMIPFRFS